MTDQNKYLWAGNVFDYLDLYDKDITDILGVSDIRLYKDGIRHAVALCFDASDKWEDEHKKKSFQQYIVNKLICHTTNLEDRCKKAEELLGATEKAKDILIGGIKEMRDRETPKGFAEPAAEQDHFGRALVKQRHGQRVEDEMRRLAGSHPDSPIAKAFVKGESSIIGKPPTYLG